MSGVTVATLPGWVDQKDITTLLAGGANTVTSAHVYKFGTQTVIAITWSDASVTYVKFDATGHLIIGGLTNTPETGTEVTWQS